MPVMESSAEFERLTRRHAIKLVPAVSCSVEEASLAVGAVVGYGSVKSASRMNGAIVLFLDSTTKVNNVVETGVVIKDTHTPVLPLVSPAKRVTISNAPPFIRNEALAKELSRHGQLLSLIKMVSLGCRSPLLRHVVCHRRQVFIVLKELAKELNLAFNFKVDSYSYVVFATSETMKRFGCGAEGHLVRRLQAANPDSGEGPPARAGGAALEAGLDPGEGLPAQAGGASGPDRDGEPTAPIEEASTPPRTLTARCRVERRNRNRRVRWSRASSQITTVVRGGSTLNYSPGETTSERPPPPPPRKKKKIISHRRF